MRTPTVLVWLQTMAALAAGSSVASAQSAQSGETIRISRAAGPITVDGDLSDEGWRGATRVEKWCRFFYAGFEFDDPNPHARNYPRDFHYQFFSAHMLDHEFTHDV